MARAARLVAAELAAARAEVEAEAATDFARVAAADVAVLRGSSASSTVFAGDSADAELRLAREVRDSGRCYGKPVIA